MNTAYALFATGFSNVRGVTYATHLVVNCSSNSGDSAIAGALTATGGIYGSGFSNTGGTLYASTLVGATLVDCILSASCSSTDTTTGHGQGEGKNSGDASTSQWSSTDANVFIGMGSNVGIGTIKPTCALDVIGAICASGDITAQSDARCKTDLREIPDALRKVLGLTGYTYTVTGLGDGRRHAGLLAQDVLVQMPELVHGDTESKFSVAYGNMAALFVEAFKTHEARIVALEKRLEDVESNQDKSNSQ